MITLFPVCYFWCVVFVIFIYGVLFVLNCLSLCSICLVKLCSNVVSFRVIEKCLN